MSKTQQATSLTLVVYRKFIIEIVVECDIRAQETCHMIQKLPLVVSSLSFTYLREIFCALRIGGGGGLNTTIELSTSLLTSDG